MRRYDPSKPLYFCHVPRTGGAALCAMLNEMIGRERVVGINEKRPGPGDIAHGHYDRTRPLAVEYLYPDAEQFFTIVRDPFDRMVSWYFYIKNVWHGHAGGEGTPVAWDVKLSDYGGTLEGFLEGYPPDVTRFLPAQPMPEALDDFVYVGYLGRMAETVRFLSMAMRVPMPKRIRTGNQCGKKDEPVTDEMRRRFREGHPEEYGLYKYALDTWSHVWDTLK